MKKTMLSTLAVTTVFAAGYLLGRATGPGAADAAPAQPAPRVFELRTYVTHEGRLDALHARFRDHTMRLFERHGMTNVGYWVPTDGEGASNTLIYLLAYPDRESARAAWAAFQADPEWQAARAASEEDGPIVARVESVFLEPTDYSPIR